MHRATSTLKTAVARAFRREEIDQIIDLEAQGETPISKEISLGHLGQLGNWPTLGQPKLAARTPTSW